MSIRELPRRKRLYVYGCALFFFLVWLTVYWRFFFHDYQPYIGILLGGIASLLFPWTQIYIIYKLAEKNKRIKKEADEYFENKHSENK